MIPQAPTQSQISPSPNDAAPRSPHVVIVGSINMDLVLRADRMPLPGETIRAEDLAFVPGGKGANQAVAVAQLGGRSTMIGRVGDDPFAPQLIQGLKNHKVDVRHVLSVENCSSGVAVIAVDPSGENAITVVGGANARLTPEDLESLESVIARADALLLQLEIPFESVSAAIAIARKHKVFTVLDPAPAPPGELPKDLYRVDVLSPNQLEARQITGLPVTNDSEARRAAEELLRRGARNAVMKLGQSGALVATDRGEVRHVPSFPVQAVDTTAAGDAFTAAMTLAHAEGATLANAARFGCAAGAHAVTVFGAQPAMPTRAQVKSLLNSDSDPRT